MTMRNISILLAMLFASFGCIHHTQGEFEKSPTMEKAVLGAGDVIEVRVFDEPDLSGKHQVSTEGTVGLPLVGNVPVAGLSPEDAADKIAKTYNQRHLRKAEVSVFVEEFNSRKVYVLGEVKTPGPFKYEENMTIIGAIARAGGTTPMAASNRTVVTREISGKQERMVVPVNSIGRGEEKDVLLKPGDIIFVPESLF